MNSTILNLTNAPLSDEVIAEINNNVNCSRNELRDFRFYPETIGEALPHLLKLIAPSDYVVIVLSDDKKTNVLIRETFLKYEFPFRCVKVLM